MSDKIKPEPFYVSGIQKVGKQYVFYRIKIENGEITQVDSKDPENLATVIERLKLDNVRTVLEASDAIK